MRGERGLDFAQLDAEAAELHLRIGASQVIELAVLAAPGQVASLVQAPCRSSGERIRISGIENLVAKQATLAAVQQIGDRRFCGAIVEHAGAAADHGVTDAAGRPRERAARRDVVVVDEVVLPVVPQTERDRQVPPQRDLVLHEAAQHFLEEHEVAVAALLHERERAARDVVLQRRERKGAARVREIVVAPPAPVRNIQAGLHEVLAR